jgi:hypothetical protein
MTICHVLAFGGKDIYVQACGSSRFIMVYQRASGLARLISQTLIIHTLIPS